MPRIRPIHGKLGGVLLLAGMLVGAALLVGLLGKPSERDGEGDSRRAWSLGLVGAMTCSLLVGCCTVATDSPSRRPQPPVAAPTMAGADDAGSDAGSTAEEVDERVGQACNAGSKRTEGRSGRTNTGVTARSLPAPMRAVEEEAASDELLSEISRFVDSVPFGRINSGDSCSESERRKLDTLEA